MKNYKKTQEKAVQGLINWKKGNGHFPAAEVKEHLKLFEGGPAEQDHKKIAAQELSIQCVARLSKEDVKHIDKRLEEYINPPQQYKKGKVL
ncbi:MAG: hypothetical protein ACOCZQ_03555 [Nanoarchaeota archaeon]